jgi:hypothetical protein
MIEYIAAAFGFGVGFMGAVALYCLAGWATIRGGEWLYEAVRWQYIVRRERKREWEAQKKDLLRYTERVAGEK